MTISDIITIISLVIAIVAIISEKNRKHLLLKFSYFDFGLYVFAFILINYFVFYKQFYSKGYFLDSLYFENFGLNNPSNYSYLISIFILITILYKVLFSFYPNRKKKQVLKYYKSLIENNEISMLLDLIERYHLKDIKKYIETKWVCQRFHEPSLKNKIIKLINDIWKNINKKSKLNKYSYAKSVLDSIINDPAFITLASNVRPYLFSNIFSTFKKEKRNSFPSDLINQFLTELIKERNFWLIKELKQSDNFDSGQPAHFFNENKIIASLIQDVSVADVNEIGIPFGEEAIKEIESEKNLGKESRLNQEYRNDDLLWEYKVFISIKFFNILITESLVQKYSGTHFFLNYYWYITEKILENLLSAHTNDFEKTDSNYHYLIKKMNDYLFHWLKLANKHETDMFYPIIECIGNQIDCITENPFFGENRKLEFIESVLSHYCKIDEKAKTNLIRDELDKMLQNKCKLANKNDPFKYISQAWTEFNKISRLDKKEYEAFARLKNNLISIRPELK